MNMPRPLLVLAVVSLLAACAAPPPPVPAAPPAGDQTAWETAQAAHLAWNGERRGWTTTASGLQYRRVGAANPNGAQPSGADVVVVHYRGTFIDGREFDSSYSRNEPAEFPLNRVIRGWTEGVGLMRAGETFEFVIPAELAYGPRGAGGGEIPPNSALRFTVELLEVKPAG
ncbi:FKBP-type peptidyl-prolyl cis-trans isomerase [Brevundimonas balnearis]|uniref:Peptidyl-prolyl cis-trans isomerase n=1 Tax=Brevundimonas balnearis TaxID=1572858 RepID=A0ABV6R6F9_9CAUL